MLFLRTLLATLSIVMAGANSVANPSPEQVQEYLQDFVEFDINDDKYLDVQEVRGQFRGEVGDPELWEFYRSADKDLDGKVSSQEYITYAAELANSEAPAKANDDL